MSERCVECGEATVWEQELGSAICTTCGTLSNPSQNILASHLENPDTSGYDNSLYWNNCRVPTLRGRSGWALAGQEKEARERRNTVSMHTFITSVLSKLSAPGMAPRAQSIFDEAMKRGQLRWGRKARLTAGASIAVALREAHRGDSIRDIAYLLEETPLSISRSFSSIVRILQLQLTLADPCQHLPILRSHLHTLLLKPSEPSPFPAQLISALSPLVPKFPGILHTATTLSTLVMRLGTLTNLPTPPTACAILILAIEGELSTSLPNMGEMAQCLGSRMGVSKKVVMERYKTIYDAIEEWIREVPWLEGHERRGGNKRRSKVAKRVVVARGLKDVVQFQEEIWQKKVAGLEKPALTLDADDDVEADDKEDIDPALGVDGLGGALDLSTQRDSREDVGTLHPSQTSKRQSVYQRTMMKASQFLLQPLSSSAESRSRVGTPSDEDEFVHLLTADVSCLSHVFAHPPTRLQRLAMSRPGGEEDIADEELFEDGELEGLLRTGEEIRALEIAFDYTGPLFNPPSGQESETDGSNKKRKRLPSDPRDDTQAASPTKRTKRINLDALARLLDPANNLCDEGAQDGHLSPDPSPSIVTSETNSVYRDDDNDDSINGDEEFGFGGDGKDNGEIIEEWRPLSPGGIGFDEDRYEM